MTNPPPAPLPPRADTPVPAGLTPPPLPAASTLKTRHRVPVWAWVVVALIALGVVILLSPIFALVSLAVLISAIVALSKKTPTWLRLRSPKAAAAVTAASAVVFLITGGITAAAYSSGSHADLATARSAALVAPAAKLPTATTTPPSASPAATPSPASYDGATAPVSAAALLATLPVKGRAPMTGYARTAEFGRAWLDIDHNGCDTRNDVLARDLSDVTMSGSCTVLTGTLGDPYTATAVGFTRGQKTSTLVQIDHMVALGNAWQTGAQQLSLVQREKLANDPLNLAAVGQRVNEQKSDGDAATWLPPSKSYRCTYVARQVSVKAAYGLWVTPAEHDAIAGILAKCPSQSAYTSTLQPLPAAPAKKAEPTAGPTIATPTPSQTTSAPEPAPPAAPAPAPPAAVPAPPSPAVVHPGSFCASPGATGVTSIGTPMVCTTTATDSRARWRKA